MAKAWLKINRTLGTHRSPDGRVDITPARVDHWISQFKRMKSQQLEIPLPWGHQPQADPYSPSNNSEDEFFRSRYNAGHVEDLRKASDGALEFLVNAPGLSVKDGYLVDPKVGTAIKEVSPAICDWPDGAGNVWKDSIRHVALCTLPVVHGQSGFTEVTENNRRELRLSLGVASVRLASGGASMPFPPKKKEEDDLENLDEDSTKQTDDLENLDEDEELQDLGSDEPEPSTEPPMPEAKPDNSAEVSAKMDELKADLEEMGIHIGDCDTSDMAHCLDVFCAAIKTHKATKALGEAENEPEEPPAGEEPNMGANNTPVTEETPPVLMSLRRKVAAIEQVQVSEHKQKQKKVIQHLNKVGFLPKPDTDRLLKELSTVKMGLQHSGRLNKTAVDLEIEVWQKASRRVPALNESLTSAAASGRYDLALDGVEEPQPMAADDDPKASQENIDEMARLCGAL